MSMEKKGVTRQGSRGRGGDADKEREGNEKWNGGTGSKGVNVREQGKEREKGTNTRAEQGKMSPEGSSGRSRVLRAVSPLVNSNFSSDWFHRSFSAPLSGRSGVNS
jgi:hypothetical protein